MSKKSTNIILANWVNSQICKQCREDGPSLGFAEHEGCSYHLAIVYWLLGGRVGDSELRKLCYWVQTTKGDNGQWVAIREKMQREIVRRKNPPEIKCQEIGIDNIDYWEEWQEGLR